MKNYNLDEIDTYQFDHGRQTICKPVLELTNHRGQILGHIREEMGNAFFSPNPALKYTAATLREVHQILKEVHDG